MNRTKTKIGITCRSKKKNYFPQYVISSGILFKRSGIIKKNKGRGLLKKREEKRDKRRWEDEHTLYFHLCKFLSLDLGLIEFSIRFSFFQWWVLRTGKRKHNIDCRFFWLYVCADLCELYISGLRVLNLKIQRF